MSTRASSRLVSEKNNLYNSGISKVRNMNLGSLNVVDELRKDAPTRVHVGTAGGTYQMSLNESGATFYLDLSALAAGENFTMSLPRIDSDPSATGFNTTIIVRKTHSSNDSSLTVADTLYATSVNNSGSNLGVFHCVAPGAATKLISSQLSANSKSVGVKLTQDTVNNKFLVGTVISVYCDGTYYYANVSSDEVAMTSVDHT